MATLTVAVQFSFLLLFSITAVRPSRATYFDYGDALAKSLLFFEAQRSGKLPPNQRVAWRSDSALDDGKRAGVDLQGGYYDAGDHVKFGFPMAFSMTMLAWGVLQYREALASSGQLGYALDALRWGTDYFIKAHPQPNLLYAVVGDGYSDHDCWQRAEDMTTPRTPYQLDASHPGSDQVGETAAAMAAASIAFQRIDHSYSSILLTHARQLFTFADIYRGRYDNSIPNTKEFYPSVSGYNDELLWAAIWLHEATSEQAYLDYIIKNANALGGTGWNMKELSWDVKYAGVQILVSKILLQGKSYVQNADVLRQYQRGAEFYLCSLVRKNAGDNNAQFTAGGLLFTRPWNNMQYVTSASFALCVYSDYLSASGQQLLCPAGRVAPSELLRLAQSQVDYMLGDNPAGMSYLVGYGAKYPRHVHHRGASIVSFKRSTTFVTCKGGYETWYGSSAANPNTIVGALVGGPDANDHYADDRKRYEQSEPTTSTNAPLVGILARFAAAARFNSRGPSPAAPHRQYINVPATKWTVRPYRTPAKTPSYKPSSPPHYVPGHKSDARHVAFRQKVTSSWTHNHKVYMRYEVSITNISPGKITNVKLSSHGLTGDLYGLSKLSPNSNLYSFPHWYHSLSPHQTITFIYVQPGPQATFYLANFNY